MRGHGGVTARVRHAGSVCVGDAVWIEAAAQQGDAAPPDHGP
jgi:predicted thioesterase